MWRKGFRRAIFIALYIVCFEERERVFLLSGRAASQLEKPCILFIRSITSGILILGIGWVDVGSVV